MNRLTANKLHRSIQTHQADIKELPAMKVDCCVASLLLRHGRQAALECTKKTTADGQLARTFCSCVRGNNSPHQQVAVVCIRHSKRETRRPKTAAIQAVVMKNEKSLLCVSSRLDPLACFPHFCFSFHALLHLS